MRGVHTIVRKHSLVFGLAALMLFVGGCGGSAPASTPTPDTQGAAAAPVPGATYHYSTVGSCDCAVEPTAVPTSTVTPAATTPVTPPATLTAAAVGAAPIITPLVSSLPPGNRLGPIEDYIVYYGRGEADILKQYDLAIVQPETLADDNGKRHRAKQVCSNNTRNFYRGHGISTRIRSFRL